MSDLPPEELVKALRDESLALQRTAWSRPDGGQDCSISANLADQAAALIERLEARVAELEGALEGENARAVKDGENVLVVESLPLGCSYTAEYAHCSHVWECYGDGGDLGGNRIEVKCRLCGAPGDYEEDFWRVVWPTT